MRVFISWSGDASRAIADIFSKWLPNVIQTIKPYFSPDDVAKGTRWATEIAGELEEARIGLIFLTRQNLNAPWLLFEAGALSKKIDISRVCPILFGVHPSDVKGPLVQFQSAQFDKQETARVLKMINQEQGEFMLQPPNLERAFEKWWPDLEKAIGEAMAKVQNETQLVKRSQEDILDEVLALTRSVAITGVRSADTYRYTIHLVDAYNHLVHYTKKEWLPILFHCLLYLGSAIYPLAELTGDDELCKKVIFNAMKVFRDLPQTTDLMAYLAFQSGIPKEALLRYRPTVEQAIQQTVKEGDAPVAPLPPEVHQ